MSMLMESSPQVNWHNYKGEQVAEHKVRVKTAACVSEVLEKLREIEPEAKRAKALRLMEVLHSKVYKVSFVLVTLLCHLVQHAS